MTQPWKFSDSSQDLLERFVKAAEKNGRNKWVKKFGHRTTDLLKRYNIKEVDKNNTILISDSDGDESSSETVILAENGNEVIDEELTPNQFSQEVAIRDPVVHIEYIMEKCRQDKKNFNLLANSLTELDMAKLLENILNSNLDTNFTEKILLKLLPTYLKRYPSRNSIDLLIKTSNHHIFNKLLKNIIYDIEIPNVILQEYISILRNNTEKIDFLNNIISFNISDEVFTHHIEAILMSYKDCNKTKDINDFIITKLTQTSQNGCNNKDYGRLLHIYLQNLRNNPTENTISLELLEKLINIHHSPFRRPCENIFNDIKSQNES